MLSYSKHISAYHCYRVNMDDYGRPQGDPSPDDDDGPRYFVTNDDDYDDNSAPDTMLG